VLERPAARRPEPVAAPAHFIRPLENVSVGAVREPKADEAGRSAPTPPVQYGSDDLDIPTFLRNRR